MAAAGAPSKMKAWQYSTARGGLDNNLKLNDNAPVPTQKEDQHLVRVIATALNPVDYKIAEVALASRFAIPKPATPGCDFVGRIVKPAPGSQLKANQLVFGMTAGSAFAGTGLAEYTVTSKEGTVPVPEGVDPVDAGIIGVAGMTAYQSIFPHIKQGSRVFINGGSGGVGVFGIQIAKALGCFVTTTCSTVNVDLCKSLGADEVIDYRKQSVLSALKKMQPFDHVVDFVGSDFSLYWHCHEYTKRSAKFIEVGGSPSFAFVMFNIRVKFLPGFLGGGKREYGSIFAEPKADQLERIAGWMAEGKVRAVIDQKFPFEQAVEAFRKLKTGRAKGKIVVDQSEGGS